jgi:hypothetical protein
LQLNCCKAQAPSCCNLCIIDNMCMSQLRSANAAAVAEVVMAAESASATASTKAARRRVRQRLHKKLASALSREEMEQVMEQFKADTQKQEPLHAQSKTSHQGTCISVTQHNLMPCGVYPTYSLPTLLPLNMMQFPFQMMVPIASKPAVSSNSAVTASSLSMTLQCVQTKCSDGSLQHPSAMSTASTVEHSDDMEEVEAFEEMWHHTSTRNECPVELPVERTFIHFRLEASFGSRRRSLSA